MSLNISNMHHIDSRNQWDKISRRQCWQGAKNLNIKFPVGAKHEEMVALFQAHGVSPEQVTKFVAVKVPTETGERTVTYPEHKERVYDERKEMRRNEEFEKRIEAGIEADKAEKAEAAKAKTEIAELRAEFNDLKDMMKQVLTTVVPAKKEPPTLKTLHWKKFQKMAKDIGETWTPKDPREPVIAKLEAGNVQEAD